MFCGKLGCLTRNLIRNKRGIKERSGKGHLSSLLNVSGKPHDQQLYIKYFCLRQSKISSLKLKAAIYKTKNKIIKTKRDEKKQEFNNYVNSNYFQLCK